MVLHLQVAVPMALRLQRVAPPQTKVLTAVATKEPNPPNPSPYAVERNQSLPARPNPQPPETKAHPPAAETPAQAPRATKEVPTTAETVAAAATPPQAPPNHPPQQEHTPETKEAPTAVETAETAAVAVAATPRHRPPNHPPQQIHTHPPNPPRPLRTALCKMRSPQVPRQPQHQLLAPHPQPPITPLAGHVAHTAVIRLAWRRRQYVLFP